MKIKMLKALIIGWVGICSNAHALNLQGYKFSNSFRYSFLEDSGLETFKGGFTFTTSIAHISTPLFVTDSNVSTFKNDIIEHYDLLTLGVAYRLTTDFSMSMDFAFLSSKVRGETISGFGDTVLKGKWLLLKDSQTALSLNPSLTLPTGKVSNYTTSHSMGAAIRSVYEKNWGDFHMLGGAGYSYANKNAYSIINYRNLLLTELGFSVDLNDKWNLNLEINRNFTLATDYRQDEGDYYLTMKNKTFKNGSIYFGGGIAGFDKLDSKNWTVFTGLKFDLIN